MRPMDRLSLLAALLCLIPGLGRAEQNLLKDGGFEDTPSAWQVRLGATIRAGEAHSGTKALMLPGPGRSDAFCGVAGLKPGQYYRVDAWARAKDVPANQTGYAAIYMDAIGSFRSNLDDHDWECVTAWFEAKDDKPFRIYLIREGISAGEILFDDLSLRECADPNLAPVTFEDGSALGVRFYDHPGTIARVVKKPTLQGSEYCLWGALASICYKMPREITTGLVEFGFMINLKDQSSFSIGTLQLDFMPMIINHEDRDGTQTRQSLGGFSPDRWYRFHGILNLDTQRYDLEVTDFEDPLASFTRKNLRLAGKMEKVTHFWLNAPKAGGLFDDLYLGPVR